MANASADKIKALGMRHGEKAVVGLTAILCVAFIAMAATKETIPLKPEDVRKAAEAAESNINRPQKPEDILAKLEEAGIKNPGFEQMVEEQEKNKLNPATFKVAQLWVSPEPGAGLIRDMPELIAPGELYAYPGRGGALVYALDENTGNRIPADKEKDVPSEATIGRRKKKRRSPMMASSSMMMASSMMPGMPAGPRTKQEEAAAKKAREEEQRKLAKSFAGKEEAAKKEEVAEEPVTTEGKEVTQGLRWVAITGTLDYEKLKENYLAALKNPAVAYPHFKQLDVQRQAKQEDGTWSEWEDIDREANNKILDNLPEVEEELTPEAVRLKNLVDPLPFLKAGYWERVHVVSLVPKEKKELPPDPAGGRMGMMGSGMGGPGMDPAMMQQQQQMLMMQQRSMMSSGMGGMEMPGAGAAEDTNFPKTDEKTVMIRSLDFTAEPGSTYRFRVRIVVYNPNKDREDVAPGVNNKDLTLDGPWSEATDEVTMPEDVATYALARTIGGNRRGDQIRFQVTRWNPDDGMTVVKEFDAGPGEIIGEYTSVPIPSAESTQPKSTRMDFNSHEIVLDTTGGDVRPPQWAGGGAPIAVPPTALLVRPDGSVVYRNQAEDVNDEVRKDIAANYKRELKESGKERENSMGSGYASFMGMGR